MSSSLLLGIFIAIDLAVYFLEKSLISSCENCSSKYFHLSSNDNALFHGLCDLFLLEKSLIFDELSTTSSFILFIANSTSISLIASSVPVPLRHPLLQFNISTRNGLFVVREAYSFKNL